MTEHKVGYLRVSSIDQNTDRQLEGLTLDKVFIDKASGKDIKRPELEKLIEFVRKGDTIVVHSMDRLARNLDNLRQLVQNLTSRGIKIQFLKKKTLFLQAMIPRCQTSCYQLWGLLRNLNGR